MQVSLHSGVPAFFRRCLWLSSLSSSAILDSFTSTAQWRLKNARFGFLSNFNYKTFPETMLEFWWI
jgi:hypothetical protein